ncbi:hypothetical protein [Archangium violaceum]|uniref:hypothetical protein n=1 Tax=Archangium violaceum TaxID=83451 RepID=UPI001269AF16|nr:hypothetical protein [Archangium violaceum]
MKYYIITETNGLPPVPDFASRLITRWPGTTVEQLSNPEGSYALDFQVPMASSSVEGLLARTRSSINFEGDLQDMSEFVQWCRTLIPPHLRLIFCDEGMNGEVKVTPPMTAEDILQAFHASGG